MKVEEGLIVLGAGGAARELYWFIQDTRPGVRIAFVDDVSDTRQVAIGDARVPVVKNWDFSEVEVAGQRGGFREFIVGVAEPRVKQKLVAKALSEGLVPAPTWVHPGAIVRPDCRLGRGGMIVAHSQLTTNATLGDYVLVLDATIGHHDQIGDYVTCYPGARVSGDVTLGEGVSIGAGAVVRNGVRVAPWVTAGASACIVKDIVEPGVTVAGVPARKLGG